MWSVNAVAHQACFTGRNVAQSGHPAPYEGPAAHVLACELVTGSLSARRSSMSLDVTGSSFAIACSSAVPSRRHLGIDLVCNGHAQNALVSPKTPIPEASNLHVVMGCLEKLTTCAELPRMRDLDYRQRPEAPRREQRQVYPAMHAR
jgi:hypothetical protein